MSNTERADCYTFDQVDQSDNVVLYIFQVGIVITADSFVSTLPIFTEWSYLPLLL